jgi:hypothetical protein
MGYKKYQVVSYPEINKSFWDFVAEMPTQMKAKAIREELGASYPMYMELKRLENLDPIQARMIPVNIN